MGRLFLITLEGNFYSCKHCQTHFALSEDILSKAGRHCRLGLGAHKVMKMLQIMGEGQDTPSAMIPGETVAQGMGGLISSISVNVTVGVKEERMMMTGMHTVVDIFCVGCGSIVGWKYEAAHEKSQKYKEGKFILERFKILGPDGSNYIISPDAQIGGSDADD
ncbi:unnamed protein product [Camellia sinensis]